MSLNRVYDKSRDAFWKPNRMGYTTNINEAGLYPREEAEAIVNDPFQEDNVIFEDGLIWIETDSYRDMPEGAWLAKIIDRSGDSSYQVAFVKGTFCTLGQHFAFDEGRVVAYRGLGNILA